MTRTTAPDQDTTPLPSYARHDAYFTAHRLTTPCLIMDLDVVAERYRQLRAALPEAEVFYAVKANADPRLLRTLARLGCGFDVASPREIDFCLGAGANPANVSYGNTVKKEQDIRYAHERGVRLYSVDSVEELTKLAVAAPGALVCCRVTVTSTGAQWPISRKFGCDPEQAVELMRRATTLGLLPYGVTFHVGSQQRNPASWGDGIAEAARVIDTLAAEGIALPLLNLGGGLPARYDAELPQLRGYADAIRAALATIGTTPRRLIIEPGRYLPGDAGMIRSQVVLVTTRTHPQRRRWVYVDIGRFGGLAETEGEAISYPLAASRPGGDLGAELGPAVLAGPTCDSADVLYEQTPRQLPTDLRPGDYLDFHATGAYTTPYASVGFNGFAPLPTYCFGGER